MPVAPKHSRSRQTARKTRRGHITPESNVGALRRRFGLPQALMARLMDISLRTVSSAESKTAAPARLRRNLNQVGRLCQALAEAMEPVFVGHWLDQPNEMLGGLKPVEAIERGQLDLVWQVVQGLQSGSTL